MKRLLALAPPALLALAACGDTCSTKPAQVQQVASCSVAPGTTVNLPVQLCQQCTDTTPTCQAEFRNGQVEVAPVFNECQAQQGCQIGQPTGCGAVPSVTCTVAVPAGTTPGSYPVIDASTGGSVGALDVGPGGAGC